MKYVFRTVVGLGLLLGAIVAMSITIYNLLGIGTCASGGPYAIARECPEGTEWLGLLIPGSVFVMLGGGTLYALRGAPPGSEKRGDPGVALLIGWCGLFLGIAFACFWGVWGPDANPGPGATEGGLIVGFLFVPMGLIPLGLALAAMRRERKLGITPDPKADMITRLEAKAPVARKSSFGRVEDGDRLGTLERLQALRERGAITQEEFDKLKRGVIDS